MAAAARCCSCCSCCALLRLRPGGQRDAPPGCGRRWRRGPTTFGAEPTRRAPPAMARGVIETPLSVFCMENEPLVKYTGRGLNDSIRPMARRLPARPDAGRGRRADPARRGGARPAHSAAPLGRQRSLCSILESLRRRLPTSMHAVAEVPAHDGVAAAPADVHRGEDRGRADPRRLRHRRGPPPLAIGGEAISTRPCIFSIEDTCIFP